MSFYDSNRNRTCITDKKSGETLKNLLLTVTIMGLGIKSLR